MKKIFSFLPVLFFCSTIFAQKEQQAHTQICELKNIPLPQGFLLSNEKKSFEIATGKRLREELYDTYILDKEKIGNRFRYFALEKRNQKDFSCNEANCFNTTYEFYKKLFHVNKNFTAKDGYGGFDLRNLENGKSTAVRFVASWSGGGIFEWFCYSNEKLIKLSIVLPGWGNTITMFEEIFAANVPMPAQPQESEMQFPVYPNSIFQPTQSSEIVIADTIKLKTILFTTSDLPEKVIAYFQQKNSQKIEKNQQSGNWVIQKEMLNWSLPYTAFVSITLNTKNAQESNSKNFTSIEYHYLNNYSEEARKLINDLENNVH